VEKSKEAEQPVESDETPKPERITFSKGYNGSVTVKNIDNTLKIISNNVEEGYEIALQVGTYIHADNLEAVKNTLRYFVNNNYKVILATNLTQEIPDDK